MGYPALMETATFPASSRRRIGLALMAYGIVGVVLAVVVAVAGVYAALRLDDVLARAEAQRTELVATLDATGELLGSLVRTLDTAKPGFDQTATLTTNLAQLATDISGTADALAGRLDVQILGLQPFAGLGVQVQGIARQTSGLADGLTALTPSISGLTGDITAVGQGLQSLQQRLGAVEERIAAIGPLDEYGRLALLVLALVVLLDIWLAIPAAVAIEVGRRLRRA